MYLRTQNQFPISGNLQKYSINTFTLRGALETIVCFSHTFDNNLGIKRKFTKYLKESCCLASDQHFSFIVFSEYAFVS